jgi:sialate O-acetylesterase
VGLINTAWHGTPAEAWTSLEGLQKSQELSNYAAAAQKLANDYPRAKYLLPGRFANYWEGFVRWNETEGKSYQKAYEQWSAAAKAAKAEGKPAPAPPEPPLGMPPTPPDSPDADQPMPRIPAVIFNGRIAPLTPYAIRGVLWYQAEGNSAKDGQPNVERAMEYRTLFPCLIADWREK